TATAFLALLAWLMGEADYARRLINQAIREGDQTEHVATIATNHLFLSRLEVTRDDPTLPVVQELRRTARKSTAPYSGRSFPEPSRRTPCRFPTLLSPAETHPARTLGS